MIRMTQFWRAAALLLTFVLLAGSALEAQDTNRPQGGRPGAGGRGPGGGGFGFGGGGPGGGRGMDKSSLLGIEQVQKELGIGEDQAFFVKELVDSQRAKSRELFSAFGNFREMSEEDRAKAMAEIQAKREKQSAEADKEIESFLSEDQRARLDQIALQVRGVRAVTDEATAKKLGISDTQKTAIEGVFTAQGEEGRKMFEAARAEGGNGGDAGGRGGASFEAMRGKMEELQKQTETKVLAVLTPAQQEQFAALKGKPFELDRAALFGGFGGGRGPGGNGGQGGGRPQRPAAE